MVRRRHRRERPTPSVPPIYQRSYQYSGREDYPPRLARRRTVADVLAARGALLGVVVDFLAAVGTGVRVLIFVRVGFVGEFALVEVVFGIVFHVGHAVSI